MIRIKGSATATALLKYIDDKLACYDISLKNNVIAIISDGASVMKKLGKDSGVIHVQCINHALHLAVMDFFKNEDMLQNEQTIAESTSNEEYEAGSMLESSYSEANYTITKVFISVDSIITKMRTIIKFIKKSSKNDEVLQETMTAEFGIEKRLQLDCSTRWNSIESMLTIFLDSLVPIQKTLIDLDKNSIWMNLK